MNWKDLKKLGSDHYRMGEIQPIDLYKSMDRTALRHWLTLEGAQHLLRNLVTPGNNYLDDLNKTEHYIKLLRALWTEKDSPEAG